MKQRAALCDALCHVLGNTCRMARTTKSYEWNVEGPGAEVARQCFREQARELDDIIDPIAKQVLSLGLRPVLDYSDGVVLINPPTAHDIPELSNMVSTLRRGHKQAALSVSAALDVARDADEMPAVGFLGAMITVHRLHRHRLSLLILENR
ncbi:ferritin-like domain-containing protein [uncultured Tateyamaria sp.]|uniref:ferritin-like domain-containing protein n=1 Tax=uncultured Tateyamaria sp. TaxID=455651 RepID=UPI0026385463|nr:ferritin-like domain-containing protein [uncultured Tateyamaria sp.]